LPFKVVTDQPERAKETNQVLSVSGGGRSSGAALRAVVGLEFVGLDSSCPDELPIASIVAAGLEFVVVEGSQEYAFVPNAGRGRRPRHLSLPEHRVCRADDDG